MIFKRYEDHLNILAQKKIDKEIPHCPFCGEQPNWQLNITEYLYKSSITCMCEKCSGKISSIFDGIYFEKFFKIKEICAENIFYLDLNAVYEIETLNSLKQNSEIVDYDSYAESSIENFFSDKLGKQDTNIDIMNKKPALYEYQRNRKKHIIWGLFIFVFFAILMLLIYRYFIIIS